MKKYFAALTAVACLLSLTSYYSIGYLSIIIAASFLNQSTMFKSILQRFSLMLLIFMIVISLSGFMFWFLHIGIIPLINVVAFAGILLVYNRQKNISKGNVFLFDKSDIVALAVATVPLVVLLGSFGLAENSRAALFQLASEGWDNGAHLQAIDDISIKNGYNYGPKDDTATPPNTSYPLAWHLATAHLTNGFGEDQFSGNKPLRSILFYMTASIAWMTITIYLFVIAMWRFYEYSTKKRVDKSYKIISFASIGLLVSMIVMWGSLASGFTNYLGSLAYLLILVILAIEYVSEKKSSTLIFALLAGTMSVLTWFLVLPAVALMLFVMTLGQGRKTLSPLISALKDWRVLVVAIVSTASMLLQLYIFVKYSSVGGPAQLNDGVRINPITVVAGVFPVNQVLFGIITLSGLSLYFNDKFANHRRLIVTIIIPWLLLALGLFVYQNMENGYNSYYLSKVLGLSLVVTSVVFATAFICFLDKLLKNTSQLAILTAPVILTAILVLGTGQSLYGFSKLFQHNTRTTYAMSEQIVNYYQKGDFKRNKVVVFTHELANDTVERDDHGKFESKVLNKPHDCSLDVTEARETLKVEIKHLSSCADKLAKKDKTLTVITSEKTNNKVKALHKSNIIIRKAY